MPRIPADHITAAILESPSARDFAQCPICGQVVEVDHQLTERACGHIVKRTRDGGLNAHYSLASTAKGLSMFFGVGLEPKVSPVEVPA